VGIAAQLPGGGFADGDLDYTTFFDFLLQRGEAYGDIPKERFNAQYLRGTSVGKVHASAGSFLKDIDQFDYLEFGVTAKDAQLMPLSARKLIELSFVALQDSGIDYRGKNVGCYMSGVAHDMFAVSGHDDAEAKGSFAYAPSMLANRVSYHLDLRGPSLPVDTACSSSLYATHLAVQALRNGECEAALVGGSQINHRFSEWLTYTQGGVLSPDGKCKPFDVTANGFGRGEGIVVIVLKPLEAALRDDDHVYATILGTGVNSSGSLVPANAPAAPAQRDAMLRAFSQARRRPSDVDFVELHATGTAQGDPTEANWVGDAFKRDDEIVIGSVKGNIGHLEITAFLASLCKVCGIFNTGTIPPNVNLSSPNPAIKWSQYRLRVPLEPEPLRCRSGNGRPLVAMTSSGIGGANGHVVVQGPPPAKNVPAFWTMSADAPVLLVAAALSPRSVTALGEALLATASGSTEAATLARLAGRRARSMTWRSFAVVGTAKAPTFSKPVIVPKTRPPIVFVFSGQGTQHFHMGRELFRTCAPFRESILELDQVYTSVVGTSLVESTGLFDDSPEHPTDTLGDPWPIAITLPALTMLQLALVEALAAAGVRPDVVVGHSAGETAVLSASGAASNIVALKLAIARGRALSLLEDAKGTMAAVSCSPKQAQTIIDEVNADLGKGVLEVGCYNTAGAVTLSGEETHVELAVAKATAAGIFARRLKTRIPVHSAMMEMCRAEFMRLLADIFPADATDANIPKIATYSTVTGGLFDGTMDTDYYWDGTIKPVLFQNAIEAMLPRYKGATFVEIGPHPVLTGYLRTMAEGVDNITITCPLRRARTPTPGTEVSEFLTALGSVVAAGHNCVDFDALYGSAGRPVEVVLPKYPFAPKNVPWFVHTPEIVRQRQQRNGPLNYAQLRLNAKTHPELADHVIKGEPIMPASGFIEMALEFGATELYDIAFHRLLPLSSERPTPVNVELHGTAWSVNSTSTADHSDTWPINYNRRHATGFLSTEPTQDLDMHKLDIESTRASMKPVKTSEVYSGIAHFLQYGPLYRRIQECHTTTRADGTVEALVKIKGRDDDLPNIEDYVFHPAILDAAIHIVAHPMMTGNYDRDLYHLPDKVSAFRTSSRLRTEAFPEVLYAKATTIAWAPEAITFDIVITDDTGSPLCMFDRLEVARHGFSRAAVQKRYDVVYEPTGLVLPVSGAEFLMPTAVASPPTARELLHAPSLIMDYVRGEEMKLQAPLKALDPRENVSLLFIAQDGLNGDAAVGFTRSLRKEYPAWTVRVAVFDGSLSKAQQIRCADVLSSLPPTDLEMSVGKDGVVHVPRITLSSAPSERVPFDPQQPWTLHEGDVTQTHTPRSQGEKRIVQVSAVHPHGNHIWAFAGTLEGSTVVGITSSPVCSHLEVHEGSIAEYGGNLSGPELSGPSLLAPTIAALLVVPATFLNPIRLRGKRALIFAPSHSDEMLARDVQSVLIGLGMETAIVTSLEGSTLKLHYSRKPHFLAAWASDRNQMTILQSLVPSSGHALFWNDPDVGIAKMLADDPWIVGDAVRAA
ncbi:ketoacyl-synt-domain-containing protein, partial [Polyporus arcularius HHB13444]